VGGYAIANLLHLLTFRLQVVQWLQVVNSDVAAAIL
jgi:hypothetical protein